MSKLSNTNYPLAFLSDFVSFYNQLYYHCIFFLYYVNLISVSLKRNPTLGDYSGEVHLFPFRTEKLSPPAQMVLHNNVGEYVVATFQKPRFFIESGFFVFIPSPFLFTFTIAMEYILIKTEKQFTEVFTDLKNSLLELEDKSFGASGHERDGLNIGDGQYYSFGDFNKLSINLIRNEGHADLFDSSWKYYVSIERVEFTDDSKYDLIKDKIKKTLDFIGETEVTTEIGGYLEQVNEWSDHMYNPVYYLERKKLPHFFYEKPTKRLVGLLCLFFGVGVLVSNSQNVLLPVLFTLFGLILIWQSNKKQK